MRALGFGQGALFLTEEARVGDVLPIRERGKGLESHIDADHFLVLVGGKGVGSHSQAMVTNHLPVAVRRMVAVLGVPSRGR